MLFNSLAASPLRLYGHHSIVSVQCPVKVFRKTLDEAMSTKFKKWLPYFKKTDKGVDINIKSSWYAEAQGQLHITGKIKKTTSFSSLSYIFPKNLLQEENLFIWSFGWG